MINLSERLKVINNKEDKDIDLHIVHERLEKISEYMEKEIAFKQRLIDGQEEQIGQLKARIEEKDSLLKRLEGQLLECRQTNEGTRQLINKLLSDISNYQKDIDWYKRTYERRSFLGIIKQKFLKKVN
jgi:hypothetical protein